MTDPKTETVWITIPDEATATTANTSLLDALTSEVKNESSDKVKNRVFWGGGFVALVAFVAMLLAPQQFASLMQGNLFDGSFQVVPDFEDQGGTLFSDGEESEAGAEADEAFEDEIVVAAESEAVSIQIEPLTDAEGEGSDGESADGESADGEELDANAKLLQALSKQLEDFKEKENQNEQLIQDLMQMLEDQAAGVHSAGTTFNTGLLPEGQTGQIGTQATAQFGVGTGVGAGTYRYNTHTVTVSPYDILSQNQAAQTQQATAYQASLPYGAVQPYSQQTYNPVLAGVQGQPDTGPAETALFALLLASFGTLVWGTMRAIRA